MNPASRGNRFAAPAPSNIDLDDDDDAKADVGYAWETRFDRTWDQITEDPLTGSLQTHSLALAAAASAARSARHRRRHALSSSTPGIQRSIIRFVVLVLDMSKALGEAASTSAGDMRPSRAGAVMEACEGFVRGFFDQNPVSHLCVMAMRDGVCERVSGMGANPAAHVAAIRAALEKGAYGETSLENALLASAEALQGVPSYGMKEVVIVYGSLMSTDRGDIRETIEMCKNEKIRAEVIGMGAELFVLKSLANTTGGRYSVAMNEIYLSEMLQMNLTPPPTAKASVKPSLIPMGFPTLKVLKEPKPSYNDGKLIREGYECPRCNAFLSEVPAECVLCELSLVTSPHLARSYHHLFPIPLFSEVPTESVGGRTCAGCFTAFAGAVDLALRCVRCGEFFCFECDAFIHESLHNCPGCENLGIDVSSVVRMDST